MNDQPFQPDQIDRLVDEAIDAGRVPRPVDDAPDELALQLEIDASLRRLFEPARADVPGLDRDIDASLIRLFSPSDAIPITRTRRRWVPALAAAAILLLVSGVILFTTGYAGQAWRSAFGAPEARTLADVYHEQIDSGVVAFPCETPDQFQRWIETTYRTSIRPVVEDEPLTFVGWNYHDWISRYTGVMIGEARGEGVVVLADMLERDRSLDLPEGSGLRLFRREVGPMVFYEITPLDEPLFLPTFEIVD